MGAVIVAETAAHRNQITLETMDLEYASESYRVALLQGVRRVAGDVTDYAGPEEFTRNITKHSADVVLSIWSGRQSRSRRSLIPAICEANGIRYVGADAYAQILCQDKALAKRFCADHGISSAKGQLVRTEHDLARIRWLRPPLVVKPNLEGGSIGVSANNLVEHVDEAAKLALKLLQIFQQPVLVEEFLPGREISIVCAGTVERLDLVEAVELYAPEVPDLWDTAIFGYELKKAGNGPTIKRRRVTEELPKSLIRDIEHLFVQLGKVEVLRIDGRYHDGVFSLIELSPDVNLSPRATVASAFAFRGYDYIDMLALLFRNARIR